MTCSKKSAGLLQIILTFCAVLCSLIEKSHFISSQDFDERYAQSKCMRHALVCLCVCSVDDVLKPNTKVNVSMV